ncbi:hypothetical protein [Streptomyces sp. SID13031]|uniref:hypothetical protein n=1 Tax=Streptomyces sp. SID13031 TaxID=2706046 RepID=UPI0013CB2A23|nr:hypothetical protein [Streptomyces sp. SID13031]NEA31526.1 hypothetical protein [Streptomyces sp. SID13031]
MLTARTLAGAVAIGALALLTVSSTAFAWDPPKPPPPPTTGGQGHTVTITVVGTGVKGGSAGKAGRAPVVVYSPCWMTAGYTGKEYYEWVSSGEANRDWYHQSGGANGPFKPKPGYEKYKDDDKGHWYGGSCSSEGFEDLKEFFAFSDKWFAEHESVYVPVGVEPPVPPIPPEVLREAATKAMTLPEPKIDWNPKVKEAAGGTLVNFDTWVWLTDRNTNRYVEATAGGNTVRVDAALESMTVSAPNAGSADCKDGGVPYAAGATGECAITFTSSSPTGGTSPVRATTQWSATWSVDGTTQGPIPDPLAPATDVTNIAVREIEAIGTR